MLCSISWFQAVTDYQLLKEKFNFFTQSAYAYSNVFRLFSSAFFPLTFWKHLVHYGPGGGVPSFGENSVTWFFEAASSAVMLLLQEKKYVLICCWQPARKTRSTKRPLRLSIHFSFKRIMCPARFPNLMSGNISMDNVCREGTLCVLAFVFLAVQLNVPTIIHW